MHKGYDLYNAAVPIGLIAFFLRSLLYKIFTSAPPASENVGLADSFVPVSVGFCLVVFALAIIWGLAAKGYLHKTVQAHDRREIVLTTSEKFSGYFDENEEEMQKKVAALSAQFTPEELCSAERVLLALGTLL